MDFGGGAFPVNLRLFTFSQSSEPNPMPDEAPRLYLLTPLIADAGAFLPRLEAALRATDVACVLLRLDAEDARSAERMIRELAEPAQARGAAVIIEGEADRVLRLKVDGLHVQGCGAQLATAIKRLSPDYIVGVGGLATRDDAMRAGEADADYVLFGDLDERGGQPSPRWTLERTRWWAEIFNTPCVAVARGLAEIGPLAAAGADFVMLEGAVWDDPRGPAAAIADVTRRLALETPQSHGPRGSSGLRPSGGRNGIACGAS